MTGFTSKTKKKTAARIISCTAVFLCMAAIFIFSCQNAAESSSVSGSLIEKVASLLYSDFHKMTADEQSAVIDSMQGVVRTGAHAAVYCLLGILTAVSLRTFDQPLLKGFLWAVLFCLLYAISDEIHQSFVPGRSMQLQDVLIDLAGSVTGSAVLNWFYYIFTKKRRKQIVPNPRI